MIAKIWLRRCWQWQIGGSVALVGTLSIGISKGVFAQIVPDNTLGAEGSVVTPDVISESDRVSLSQLSRTNRTILKTVVTGVGLSMLERVTGS